jgi:hypothetical protein
MVRVFPTDLPIKARAIGEEIEILFCSIPIPKGKIEVEILEVEFIV